MPEHGDKVACVRGEKKLESKRKTLFVPPLRVSLEQQRRRQGRRQRQRDSVTLYTHKSLFFLSLSLSRL